MGLRNFSSPICLAVIPGVVLKYDQTFILPIARKQLRQINRNNRRAEKASTLEGDADESYGKNDTEFLI